MTQAILAETLGDEYERAKGLEGYIDSFLSSSDAKGSIASRAYEAVVVCSSLSSTPLPIEILPRFLEVEFTDWVESYRTSGVSGLIYEETFPAYDTSVYRTRNTVVTEVMLKRINAGSGSQAKDFKILKKLLNACVSTNAPYKTFIHDILVVRRKLLKERFAPELVVELYDTAIGAYPGKSGLVQYHRALAAREIIDDPNETYEEVAKLLPDSEARKPDTDSPDKLHTTLAASVTAGIKFGSIDPETGGDRIFHHVSRALEINPNSSHSMHAHAKALITIAAKLRTVNPGRSSENITRAAYLIERSLGFIGPVGIKDVKGGEEIAKFRGLREEILIAEAGDTDITKHSIDAYRKEGNQAYLSAAARILLASADASGRGGAYKKAEEFVHEALKAIRDKDATPGPDLLCAKAQIQIAWKLLTQRGRVSWEVVRDDLNGASAERSYRLDPQIQFYKAVAHYQLGEWEYAENLFAGLRVGNIQNQFKAVSRCVYQGTSGEAEVFQGGVSNAARGRRFVYSSVLGNDVLMGNRFGTYPDGALVHFKIVFSYLGPLAVEVDDPATRPLKSGA